jgi:hypothetical protein
VRDDRIDQMRRRVVHATGIARGTDTTSFAGEGDEQIVAAIAAADAGEAMRAFILRLLLWELIIWSKSPR